MALVEQNPARIMKIVMHVIAQLRDAETVNDIDIDALRNGGYTEDEISVAVGWLVDQMEHSLRSPSRSEMLERPSSNFRTLHPAERILFSKEAHGELVQMQTLGIINAFQIEQVIERSVLAAETSMTTDTLHSIVSEILFRDRPRQRGNRIMARPNSSIH